MTKLTLTLGFICTFAALFIPLPMVALLVIAVALFMKACDHFLNACCLEEVGKSKVLLDGIVLMVAMLSVNIACMKQTLLPLGNTDYINARLVHFISEKSTLVQVTDIVLTVVFVGLLVVEALEWNSEEKMSIAE